MRKTVFIILSLFLSGCVANTAYTVTPAEYAQQVKALGVLPVLIDAESIDYAARDELFSLLELSTAAVQQTLVDKLRKQGRHFDVRPVTGDPESIRTRILAGQSTVGETASTHLKYTFSSEGSAALADEAVADALLVVVVHGIKRQEKRWSSFSLQMDYLRGDYSSLLYTAAVVDPTGRVLWQFDMEPGEVLLPLDYADFTEAYWNHTDSVRIKPITLPGLQRTMKESQGGLMVDKEMPKPFGQMVDQIVGGMK
jgi:hypothetical protein